MTIRAAGDRISDQAGDVENLSSGVEAAHRPAQEGVAGLLGGPMASAPDSARLRATEMLQGALFGGAAVRLFGDHVRTYNAGIQQLNLEWAYAETNDFGQQRADPGADASPEETAAADDAFDAAKAEARAAKRAELVERQQALQGDLDAGADEVALLLAGGVTDAALVRLFEAGALSNAAPVAFPGSDLAAEADTGVRWMNLVATGQIPDELYEMDEDEVLDYLRDHPDLVPELGLLLTAGSLGAQELVMLRALARHDAGMIGQAARSPGPRLDLVAPVTGRLREINARRAANGSLTDAEQEYLHAWFDGISPDDLATWSNEMNDAHHTQIDDRRVNHLRPVANAIMNLSHGRTLDDMPETIQELVRTRLGETYANEVMIPIWSENELSILGLDRFAGFADLMATATVQGSDEFTYELGANAIRARQDLNSIASWALEILPPLVEGSTPEEQLPSLIGQGDRAASRMLSVVAGNEAASSRMLTDEHTLRPILGLNWHNADGAVSVILSGTGSANPSSRGGEEQAQAALDLMQEAGQNRGFYREWMSEDVRDAMVVVGISWVDVFGENVESLDDSDDNRVVELHDHRNQEYLGIEMYLEDQQAFLRLIAHMDGQSSGAPESAISNMDKFSALAKAYSSRVLADAIGSGDPWEINLALEQTGRIQGSIIAANEGAIADERGVTEAEHESALADVRSDRLWAELVAENVVWGPMYYAYTTNLAANATSELGLAAFNYSNFSSNILDNIMTTESDLEHRLDVNLEELANEDERVDLEQYQASSVLDRLFVAAANQARVHPVGIDQEVLEQFYVTSSDGHIQHDENGRRLMRSLDSLEERSESGEGWASTDITERLTLLRNGVAYRITGEYEGLDGIDEAKRTIDERPDHLTNAVDALDEPNASYQEPREGITFPSGYGSSLADRYWPWMQASDAYALNPGGEQP